MSGDIVVILIFHRHKLTNLIYYHHPLLNTSQQLMLLVRTLAYLDPKLFVLIVFYRRSFLLLGHQ
jgi:hypothetical protein